jgi:hypothetical protein
MKNYIDRRVFVTPINAERENGQRTYQNLDNFDELSQSGSGGSGGSQSVLTDLANNTFRHFDGISTNVIINYNYDLLDGGYNNGNYRILLDKPYGASVSVDIPVVCPTDHNISFSDNGVLGCDNRIKWINDNGSFVAILGGTPTLSVGAAQFGNNNIVGDYGIVTGEDNTVSGSYSAIIGGNNNEIDADSDNTVIIGGNNITATNIDNAAIVPNLYINTVPSSNGSATKVLVRNTTSGKVEEYDMSSLPGGGGGSNTYSDTNSIDLTLTGSDVTADVRLDPAGSNLLSVSASGILAEETDTTVTNLVSGNRIGTYTNEAGTTYDIDETITGLALSVNNLTYTKEDGSTDVIDLSAYLDNENNYVTGGTFNTTNGIITFTRQGLTNFGVTMDGRYALSSHTHVSTDITDFQEAVDDAVNNLLVAGNDISFSYNDVANTFTINSTATDTTYTAGTGLNLSSTEFSLQHLGLESLIAPIADRIFFYDQSGGTANWLEVGSGLQIVGNVLSSSTGGGSDYYSGMTDGSNSSAASGSDTFKFRSANSLLTTVVGSNDITHGDNLLLTVEPNLSNYTNDAGFITSAPVTSVFGRTGVVVAATSDYDAIQIDVTPSGNLTSNNVQDALEELQSDINGINQEATSASNLGAGEGVYSTEVSNDLRFKSLIGGTNISLSSNTNEITINSTDTNTQLSQEEVQDFAGPMFDGNATTLITSAYNDATNKVDLTVNDDLSLYDNTTSGFLTSVTAHASTHIRGGSDEIDGDQLDIDYVPSNYNPATIPAQVSNVSHLTAHLYGIDQKLGTIVTDTNNYVDGISFNTSTGDLTLTRNGLTDIVENLDGRYSLTDNNDIDYINSASFVGGTLTLSGVGNAGTSVSLDGRYLQSFTETDPVFTGSTVSNIVDGTGFLTNDGAGNWSYDNTTYSTFTPTDLLTDYSFTDNSTNWNTAYNNHIVGIGVTGTTTKTITLTQQDGGTLTANFTDLSGAGGDGNDFLDNATFNTTNGELTLEVTNQPDVVVDLDGRYALIGQLHDAVTVTDGNTIDFTLTGQDLTGEVIISTDANNALTTGTDNALYVPTVSGGTMDDFTVAGDGGIPQTISDGNTLIIAGGTGISTSSGAIDTITINNDAPDQTVVLNNGTGINVTGTYPNFTINSTVTDTNTTYTSNNGITLTGTNFKLGGTLDASSTTTLSIPSTSTLQTIGSGATTFNSSSINIGTSNLNAVTLKTAGISGASNGDAIIVTDTVTGLLGYASIVNSLTDATGTGETLINDSDGVLKTLIGGTNVTLSSTADSITINAAGGGGTMNDWTALAESGSLVVSDNTQFTITGSGGISTSISGNTLNIASTNIPRSKEEIQDDAWDVLGGTQTLINVTYQDGTNDVDFIVEDDLSLYDNSTSQFLTSASLSGYVPYTGATSDVNLGSFDLSLGDSLTFTGSTQNTIAIPSSSYLRFGGSGQHDVHVLVVDEAFSGGGRINMRYGSAGLIFDNVTGTATNTRGGITPAGDMYIGDTTPTEKLDVDGKIRMRTSTQDADAGDIVVTKDYLDADNINFTPTGNTTSTDVQAAIVELQTEIDGLGGPGYLGWNIEGDSGSGSVTSGSTIDWAGGTGIATAYAGGMLTTSLDFLGFQDLTDPNDDRIAFWDESANAFAWLDLGEGLGITGTVIENTNNSWLKVSDSSIPTSINDNIYTLGTAAVGTINGNYSFEVAGSMFVSAASGATIFHTGLGTEIGFDNGTQDNYLNVTASEASLNHIQPSGNNGVIAVNNDSSRIYHENNVLIGGLTPALANIQFANYTNVQFTDHNNTRDDYTQGTRIENIYYSDASGNLQSADPDSLPSEHHVRVFAEEEDITTGDNAAAFYIGPKHAGKELKRVIAIVDEAGITGTLSIMVNKSRSTTPNTGDALTATMNITTGTQVSSTNIETTSNLHETTLYDRYRIDIDSVHSGTAPKGLTLIFTFE